MNNRTFFISLVLIFAALVGSGQESHLKIKRNKMQLFIEKEWSQLQADSIAKIYALPHFNIDSLGQLGFSKSLFTEGWSFKKMTKKQVVLEKSLLWDKMDWNDMYFDLPYDSREQQSANLWNPKVFGYNDFKEPRVYENADGTTTFECDAGPNVHSVILSGTFNKWSTTEGLMHQTSEGWKLTLKLKPGRHEYKFIVDGKWTRDAKNNLKIEDNYGDFNSVYFKPNHIFYLKDEGYRSVVVPGSFNDWDEKAAQMKRVEDKWQLAVFLPEGQYEYRFIVDGNWREDPANNCIVKNEFNENNSCLSIGKVYYVEIRLQGFSQAQSVVIAGSFDDWNEEKNTLTLENGEWVARLPLRKGKWEYRYIIDGQWYTDFSSAVIPSSVQGEMNNYIVVEPNYEFTLEGYTNATSVLVSGSFNNWDERSLKMSRTPTGWTLPFYFDPGKITYKFIVDGNWIEDPKNEQYEINEFGGKNSIRWID